jgi:hypothetical protein
MVKNQLKLKSCGRSYVGQYSGHWELFDPSVSCKLNQEEVAVVGGGGGGGREAYAKLLKRSPICHLLQHKNAPEIIFMGKGPETYDNKGWNDMTWILNKNCRVNHFTTLEAQKCFATKHITNIVFSGDSVVSALSQAVTYLLGSTATTTNIKISETTTSVSKQDVTHHHHHHHQTGASYDEEDVGSHGSVDGNSNDRGGGGGGEDIVFTFRKEVVQASSASSNGQKLPLHHQKSSSAPVVVDNTANTPNKKKPSLLFQDIQHVIKVGRMNVRAPQLDMDPIIAGRQLVDALNLPNSRGNTTVLVLNFGKHLTTKKER